MRHLLVMAAGTGGHVIPGLAVAAEMKKRGWTVSWLGTSSGMENRLVPGAGIALDRVSFSGMRGKGLVGNALGALRLIGAFFSSARIVGSRRADAVLGMGGYICFPGGWAAWLLRKPLLVVNADAELLLSNRLLSFTSSASVVLVLALPCEQGDCQCTHGGGCACHTSQPMRPRHGQAGAEDLAAANLTGSDLGVAFVRAANVV